MDNPGPKITLSYAYLSRVAQGDVSLFVPWNYGGRKFEKRMGGDYATLEKKITECKEYYQEKGYFSDSMFEARKTDSIFKNIVLYTLESPLVSKRRVKIYEDSKTGLEKLMTDRSSSYDSTVRSKGILTLPKENLRSISEINVVSDNKRRIVSLDDEEYLLQIYRERNGDTHWNLEKALNQRFVAMHWVKYAHERFQPEKLQVVCGTTVEYKWLIPSLALLDEEQQQNTTVSLHGAAKNLSFLEGREQVDMPLALASRNAGADIQYTEAVFDRVKRLRRKLANVEKYFIDYAQSGRLDRDYLRIETLLSKIDNAFLNGKNQKGLDLLNEYAFSASNELISRVKEQGVSPNQKRRILEGLSSAKTYCN